jgi:hypothetical protein
MKYESRTKCRRDLVLKDRPNIRPMDIGNEESYGKDMGILWAAYKAGSFAMPEDLTQEQFATYIVDFAIQFDSVFMVEDRNPAYKEKGPVAVIMVKTDREIIRPDIDYFKWATAKNILRTTVAFFQWVRYSKDVGMCVFGSTLKTRKLYERMREYGILVWHVGNGYYGLAGRKECLQQ